MKSQISQLSQTHFLALGLVLSLGCGVDASNDQEGIAQASAALERSSDQVLVELNDSSAIAFESVKSVDKSGDDVSLAGEDCILLRPAGWSGSGIQCAEYFKPAGSPPDTLPMVHGESFLTSAGYAFPGPGYGFAFISCNDGRISIQRTSCLPGYIP